MKYNIYSIVILLFLTACKVEPRRPIVAKSASMQQSVKINRQQNKKEEMILQQFIKKDSLLTYKNSKKGFWYAYNVVKKDKKYIAKTDDIIIFACQIEDVNGVIIYSFNELGQQRYKVNKQDIIKGLQEGLLLLQEGEECTFLFPSYKAYGYVGDEKKIRRNQPLVYKIKLIKINKN